MPLRFTLAVVLHPQQVREQILPVTAGTRCGGLNNQVSAAIDVLAQALGVVVADVEAARNNDHPLCFQVAETGQDIEEEVALADEVYPAPVLGHDAAHLAVVPRRDNANVVDRLGSHQQVSVRFDLGGDRGEALDVAR